MVAYAAVFLMKVTTKWNRVLGLNVEQAFVWSLLERIIQLLKSSVTSIRHLLYHIAAGLEKMLKQHDMLRQNKNPMPSRHSNTNVVNQEGILASLPVHQLSPSSLEAWDPFVSDAALKHGPGDHGHFNHTTIMNNNMIYESFGTDSAHDVYNFLSSQFSY
jgi:hypothetical protein